MADGDDRAAHLAWCKARALEYLDAGDLANAAASMLSDMSQNPATALGPNLGLHWVLAIRCVIDHDEVDLRRWIEGFN